MMAATLRSMHIRGRAGGLPRVAIDGIEYRPMTRDEDSLLRSRRQRRRSNGPGRVPARSALAAVVAIMAMVLQGIVPLPHDMLQSAPARAGVPEWAIGHLCVADAYSPTQDNAPGGEAPVKSLPLCPICLGLQLASTTVPPHAMELAPPGESRVVRFAEWRAGANPVPQRSLAQPRAPPRIT
jgi:hypothetical protein